MTISYDIDVSPTESKKRILLIDDESAMTDLVGRVLTMRGYALESRNNPVDGVARALEENFDAVIVDLMMPDLDGFAVLGQLRASPRHAQTPIMVLSARNLSDEERKRLLQFGVRFIPKPFTPARLFDAVRAVVTP